MAICRLAMLELIKLQFLVYRSAVYLPTGFENDPQLLGVVFLHPNPPGTIKCSGILS